jgi:flagellin
MSFGISGISANTALLNYSNAQSRVQRDSTELSTGLAINSAGDNPSGLAIGELLQAQVNGADQGASNDQNALNALAVADGAGQGTENILQSLNSLAVQASNDALSSSDRADIQAQANQLVQQINTNASQTDFNGVPLLTGSSFTVNSGGIEGSTTTSQTPLSTAASLGVANLNFSSTQSAQAAQTSIQSALTAFSGQQSQLGAQETTIQEDLSDQQNLATNLQSSESSVMDADIPSTVTDLNQASIQSQAAVDVIAAVNKENATLAGIYIDKLI